MTIRHLPIFGGNTELQYLRMGIGSIAGICAFFIHPGISYLAMLIGGDLEKNSHWVAVISFLPLLLAVVFYSKFKSLAVSTLAFVTLIISVFGNWLFESEIRALIANSTGFYSEDSALPTFSHDENTKLSAMPIGDFTYEIKSPNSWSPEIETDHFETRIKYTSPSTDTASLVVTCFNPYKKGSDVPTLVRKFESVNNENPIQTDCHLSPSGNNVCLIDNRTSNSSVDFNLYLSSAHAPYGLKVLVESEHATEEFKTDLIKVLTSISATSLRGNTGECRNISRLKNFPST